MEKKNNIPPLLDLLVFRTWIEIAAFKHWIIYLVNWDKRVRTRLNYKYKTGCFHISIKTKKKIILFSEERTFLTRSKVDRENSHTATNIVSSIFRCFTVPTCFFIHRWKHFSMLSNLHRTQLTKNRKFIPSVISDSWFICGVTSNDICWCKRFTR